MIKKARYWLKNDIEKDKSTTLLAEVVVFILLWKGLCFLYFTQSLHGLYKYYMESSSIITIGCLTCLVIIFLILFIITSFCVAELIYRARARLACSKIGKSQEGWILIESLVGIVILSTAVVALVLGFTQATKGTTESTNRTQATYLAQQALEDLKAQDGDSTIDTTRVSSSVVIPPTNGIVYTVTADPLPVSAITSDTKQLGVYLKPYQVTVSWVDSTGGNASKNVKLVGYFYVNP